MRAAENPSRAQALVVVDELARCGVRHAVLAPGSRSAALAMALHEDPRVATHVEIDERAAGFLALGAAKASGVPTVVVTTSGTATANLYPAVVEADAADVPIIVLTADRPPELRGTGANQTIDQTKLFGDRVRWFTELGVAEDRDGVVAYWRSTVCRLWGEAAGVAGRSGPVHANVPVREPTVPASDDGRATAPPFTRPLDGRPHRRPWTAVHGAPRRLTHAELSDLAGRIAATERGLIVVGDADTPPGPVAALARAAGWPVIAEPMSGLRGDDTVIGTAALLLDHPGFARKHRPDLVLRMGRQGLSRGVARLLGPDVPQVLLDAGGRWLDPGRAVSEILAADPGLTCAALARHLGVAAGSDWLDSWRRIDGRVRARVDETLDAERDPTEPRTARDVVRAVPDDGILVVSSSMPVRDLDAHMPGRRRLRVVANRGASGIDGVVSTVLGVALASPSRAVVGLLGDLALLHDANGLLVRAAADSVDAVLVVVDNDGGGIFSFLPQADYPLHFEAVFGTPHGRDLTALAAFHDLPVTVVDVPDRLEAAVTGAVRGGGVRLVVVRTDRKANVEVHRRVRRAVADVLDDV